MGVEIERKFLVKDDSFKRLAEKSVHITQGYLNRNAQRTVRVRIRDNQAFLTVKGISSYDSRMEYEYEIPVKDAEEMISLCEGAVLDKTRFLVRYKGFLWEIDEFHNLKESMTIAEIELPSSETVFPVPPFVGEDVTGDPRYFNSNLA